MKTALGLALLVAMTSGSALAATPAPAASGVMQRKISTPLTNPGSRKHGPQSLTGAACIGPRVNDAQTAVNPITGLPQAGTLVSIPITGGNVANSTTRAQQSQACLHHR